MKTFLTALLIVLGLAVALHIAPLLLAPFAAGAAVLTGAGSVLFGGIAAILGGLIAVLTVIVCALGIILLVLSPIWMPVLLLTLILRSRKTA